MMGESWETRCSPGGDLISEAENSKQSPPLFIRSEAKREGFFELARVQITIVFVPSISRSRIDFPKRTALICHPV